MKNALWALTLTALLVGCGDKSKDDVVESEPENPDTIVTTGSVVEFANDSNGIKPLATSIAVEYGELLERREELLKEQEEFEKEMTAPTVLETRERVGEVVEFVEDEVTIESYGVDVQGLPDPVNSKKSSNLGYNKMVTESISFSGDVVDLDSLEFLGDFKATAYDLSYESCEKHLDDPDYGITKSGVSVKGMTRDEARVVAVDPTVIPLGTKLFIQFPHPYSEFSGNYTALDIGGAIKGNVIDVFMGDFGKEETDQSVWDFGVRTIQVYKVI